MYAISKCVCMWHACTITYADKKNISYYIVNRKITIEKLGVSHANLKEPLRVQRENTYKVYCITLLYLIGG